MGDTREIRRLLEQLEHCVGLGSYMGDTWEIHGRYTGGTREKRRLLEQLEHRVGLGALGARRRVPGHQRPEHTHALRVQLAHHAAQRVDAPWLGFGLGFGLEP